MRVLVVVAHGDDEVLGAGGTLARHIRNGDEVAVLVMTDRDSSRHDDPAAAISRTSAIEAALKTLGAARSVIHSFDDNRLDSVPQLVLNRTVEAECRHWRPSVVYTHSLADLSADHRLVARATATACRPGRDAPVELLGMEVRSATDTAEAAGGPGFRPQKWVELTPEDVAVKLAALEAYGQELRPWPHPRSVRAVTALIEYRGTQVGVAAAEAFEVLRRVDLAELG